MPFGDLGLGAVERVAHDRMAYGGKMNAYLVRAAGFGRDFEQCEFISKQLPNLIKSFSHAVRTLGGRGFHRHFF